jgi:hypothetical protein
MKGILALSLLLAVSLSPAFAQQASSEASPATREDVEGLFTTMHIREQMRNMIDLMAKQSKEMAQDALKKKMPDLSEKELNRLTAIMDQSTKGFDLDGMISDMVPVYQHHLTKADVGVMTAFYETTTGQKMLREQPQMTAEAMNAVQPRMQKMMSSMMEDAEKMTQEAPADSKPADTNKH